MQFFKYHLQGGKMKNKILMEVADTFGLKYLEDINEAAGVYENYFLSIRFLYLRWVTIRISNTLRA